MFSLEDYEEVRDRLLYQGKPEEALEEFEAILKTDPGNAFALHGKAFALSDLSQYDEAILYFEQAVEADSTFSYPWNGKGYVLFSLSRYEEALVAYERSIELNPKGASPWNGKGNTLDNLGRYDDALVAYERSIELDPKDASPWNGKGNTLDDLGWFEEALVAYERSIDLDPKGAIPWNGKGITLDSLGRFEEALSAFKSSIELDSENSVSWYGIGNTLGNLGRFEEALEAYERSIDLDPKGAIPWNGKGNTLDNLGRFEEALVAYERSIDLDSKDAIPWNGKGNTLGNLGRFEEALIAYERSIDLDPYGALPWNGKGNAHYRLGQFEEVLLAYERSIKLDPNCALPWNGKGNAHYHLGQFDDALLAYERSIELDSNGALPWNGKGNILSGLGRFEGAFSAFERSIELDPKSAQPWINLARLSQYQGDKRLRAFRKAVSLAAYQEMRWVLQNAPHLIMEFGGIRLTERLISEFHLYESVSYFGFCYEIGQRCAMTDPIVKPDRTQDQNQLFVRNEARVYISGLIYFLEGDPEVASKLFDATLDEDESRLDAWYYLVVSRYEFNEDFHEDLEEAVNLAREYENLRIEDGFDYSLYYAGHLLLLGGQYEKALEFFEYGEACVDERAPTYLPSLYMQLECHDAIAKHNKKKDGKSAVGEDEEKTKQNPEDHEGDDTDANWTPKMIQIADRIAEEERARLLVGRGFINGVSDVEFNLDKSDFERNFFRYVHFTEIIFGVQLMWKYLNRKGDPLVAGHTLLQLNSPEKVWKVPSETVAHLETQRKLKGEELARNLEKRLDRDEIAKLEPLPPDQLEIGLASWIKLTPSKLVENLDWIAYFFWRGSISQQKLILLAFYAILNHKTEGKNWETAESEFLKFIRANFVEQGSAIGLAIGLTSGSVVGPAGSFLGGMVGSVVGKWVWNKLKPKAVVPAYLDFKNDYAEYVIELKRDDLYANWINLLDLGIENE